MKVLLIGMGPGIGLSLARRFGRENFEIMMLARNADKLAAFRESLASEGIKARGFTCDLADSKAFARQAAELAGQYPDTEVLIYNASAFNPAKPSEVNPDTLLQDMQVNALSAVLAVKAFIPLFTARRSGAKSGINAFYGAPKRRFSADRRRFGLAGAAGTGLFGHG